MRYFNIVIWFLKDDAFVDAQITRRFTGRRKQDYKLEFVLWDILFEPTPELLEDIFTILNGEGNPNTFCLKWMIPNESKRHLLTRFEEPYINDHRSMSIGDIVEIRGFQHDKDNTPHYISEGHWLCASQGWKFIPRPVMKPAN